MPLIQPPAPELWLPPKPAIVRASQMPERRDFFRDVRKARTAQLMPTFCPAAVFTGFTFSQSSLPTTATFTLPSGINVGDLIVIVVVGTQGVGAPTALTPTGYTLLANITVGIYRTEAFYKLSTGTDSGASVTTMTAAATQSIVAIFGANIASVTPSTWVSQATASAPTNQTVTGGTAPTLYIGYYSAESVVATRGFTTTADAEITNLTSFKQYFKYKIYNSAPASTTISQPDSGADNMMLSGRFNGA